MEPPPQCPQCRWLSLQQGERWRNGTVQTHERREGASQFGPWDARHAGGVCGSCASGSGGGGRHSCRTRCYDRQTAAALCQATFPRHSSAPVAASEPAVVLTGGVPAVTLPALSAVLLFVLKPEGAGVAVVVVVPAGPGLAAGAAGAAAAGAVVVVVAAAGLGVGVAAAAGAAGLGVGVAAAAGAAGAAPAAPAAGAVGVVVPASPFTLLPVPTPASISKMPAAMIASARQWAAAASPAPCVDKRHTAVREQWAWPPSCTPSWIYASAVSPCAWAPLDSARRQSSSVRRGSCRCRRGCRAMAAPPSLQSGQAAPAVAGCQRDAECVASAGPGRVRAGWRSGCPSICAAHVPATHLLASPGSSWCGQIAL